MKLVATALVLSASALALGQSPFIVQPNGVPEWQIPAQRLQQKPDFSRFQLDNRWVQSVVAPPHLLEPMIAGNAKAEPIPTEWPNAKTEPIPTTWAGLKVMPIVGGKTDPTK